ncbi:putative bifunctional diguanylate cyclase/phosphodiesterase [Paraglaciecola arctica]|uniref:putative bifunctional diguanylate cyclase/phosphodiesterase n=1 Tax=Paraglaciecola arctica TaxID=1128911 RepID=UPI001C078454|nr:bifunctional diguanylate cyclase/phosphodiesterase [Paraglaciecola arctica]MBU3002020.1 bifunctional diguanylate cyclase/phosphodiesterase [Paraglaciecola arctica]
MSINILNQPSNKLINLIFALVLVLGMAVSGVVFYKGENIAQKTVDLIAQQIPSYDLLSKLNGSLIEKERFLYEFYATQQQNDFQLGYAKSNLQAQNAFDELLVRFGDIPPLRITQSSLVELNKLAEAFVANITSTETNWDLAREQLRTISDVRRATSPQIQQLINLTEQKVEDSEMVILNGLELVRLFVVLYGFATLIVAFIVAKAIKAYLYTSVYNQRLSLFSTRNPNPVISLDNRNVVTYYNPATENLLEKLGFAEGKVDLLLAKDIEEHQKQLLEEGANDSKQFEYQIAELYFQCDLHWLEDLQQWDMHLTDITERKKFEQELQYRASFHPQTGLLNRYELEKAVTELCQTKQIFTFGLLEIRSFSQLMSGQGVTVAATVVKEVASALDNILLSIHKTGFRIFHTGEKSFALVCTCDLNNQQINSLVEQIDSKISSTIFHCQYQVQLDFGFANSPQHGSDYTQLHKNALAALDKSARSGDKSHVLFNIQLGDKLFYQQQLVEDMRTAIENAQFELYFQPQLALSNNKIIGAEALIRWQRNGQWIAPSEFIPLAERAGLIDSLGDWILHTACNKAQNLVNSGWNDLVMAVNISPLQFGRKDFLSKVKGVLKETGLEAKNLELEVTEGVIIYNELEAIETLAELKKLGVHLAIDDFGTGYSSLSYLRKFNIDKLKIDQSFIQDIQHQPADQSIVRTIIELGRNLELKVIAEGVEGLDQQDILASMGCDEIQGFYFSRPLPEQQFIDFVKRHQVISSPA